MKINSDKILERSLGIYTKFGIKSVTMDDIARELGMSKKTLYQHFDNKRDLVYKTVQYYIQLECNAIQAIQETSDNAIDEVFEICTFISHVMRERNPSLILDMKKYHPESWKCFHDHKHNYVYNNVLNNIKRGIEQGFYRNDFDPNVVAKLYVSRVEAIIDNELFPFDKYPLVHVVTEMISYHIRGIATPKGFKYLEAKLKQYQPNES